MAGLPDVNIEYTAYLAPSCPLGTAPSSYRTTAVPILNQTFLWSWEVRIPPGHADVTGIALIDSGQFIIPLQQGGMAWVQGDDEHYSFNYGKQLGSTVSVGYYNNSTLFAHGWVLYFTYTPMSDFSSSSDVIVTPDLAGLAADIEQTTGG